MINKRLELAITDENVALDYLTEILPAPNKRRMSGSPFEYDQLLNSLTQYLHDLVWRLSISPDTVNLKIIPLFTDAYLEARGLNVPGGISEMGEVNTVSSIFDRMSRTIPQRVWRVYGS